MFAFKREIRKQHVHRFNISKRVFSGESAWREAEESGLLNNLIFKVNVYFKAMQRQVKVGFFKK